MSDKPDAENILERFLLPSRVERLEQVLAQRTNHLTVVVERVHNAHNISAVMRSADAFGLTGIHLVGDQFDFSRGISLGSEKWLRLTYHQDAPSAIAALKAEGYTLAITAPADDPRAQAPNREGRGQPAIPVYDLPFHRKLALVFGNEKRGVSPEFVDAAEIRTYIPMFGFVESFNISVACAIALFCSRIRATVSTAEESGSRAPDPQGALSPAPDSAHRVDPATGPIRPCFEAAARPPLLSESERDVLRREWLLKTVKRADAILRRIDAE